MIGTSRVESDKAHLLSIVETLSENYERYSLVEEISGVSAGFIACLHALYEKDLDAFKVNPLKDLDGITDKTWEFRVLNYISNSNLRFIDTWTIEIAAFIWLNIVRQEEVFKGTNHSFDKEPGLLAIYSSLVKYDERFTIGDMDAPREIYCRTMKGGLDGKNM